MKKSYTQIIRLTLLLLVSSLVGSACQFSVIQSDDHSLDVQLRQLISANNITPLTGHQEASQAKVKLGELLFFDKILSGNQDIACATCHHPTLNSGDGIAVSIGTGGEGLGLERKIGYNRAFIPRNAPEVFNRGESDWRTMFWDSRIALNDDGSFLSPAKDDLPAGLDNILAVQAMFPVTSRDEMRGDIEESSIHGGTNEVAAIEDADVTAIWASLTKRLLSNPEYASLFQAAYPDTPSDEFGFQHAANAIAAFEAYTFTSLNSPWNRYLQGNTNALSSQAKQGALLFFGEAGCSTCHSGNLLTDQLHHNIAVPQVGPGKGDEAPRDHGRMRETNDIADLFAFRTPSLHNVALNSPYMHNGAFKFLDDAVRHHLDPSQSLQSYEPALHLPPELHDTYQNDEPTLRALLGTIDPQVSPARPLSDEEFQNLLAFLIALSDPEGIASVVAPNAVPSGLPVGDE